MREMKVAQEKVGDDDAEGQEDLRQHFFPFGDPGCHGQPYAYPEEDQGADAQGQGVVPEKELQPLGGQAKFHRQPGVPGAENKSGLLCQGGSAERQDRYESQRQDAPNEPFRVGLVRAAGKAEDQEVNKKDRLDEDAELVRAVSESSEERRQPELLPILLFQRLEVEIALRDDQRHH